MAEGLGQAVLQKIYGTVPEALQGRCSPAVCLGARKERIEGNPRLPLLGKMPATRKGQHQ